MSFTTEELKKKYGLTQDSQPSVIPDTKKSFTTEELKQKYSGQISDTLIEKKPTFGGQIVRGFLKLPAKVVTNAVQASQIIAGKPTTEPFSGKYLGEVKPVGAGFDVAQGLTPENIKAVKESIGAGIEAGSYAPIGAGVKVGIQILKQPFKQAVLQFGKQLAKEGAIASGIASTGQQLQEKGKVNLPQVAGATLAGGAIGFGLGAGGATASRLLNKASPEYLGTQLDKYIRNIFKDATGDIGKIDDMSFKAEKGLQLLSKEADNIKIPDQNAPLGSSTTKTLDIRKATPNELLSGVLELDKKIANIARKATEKATNSGRKIETEQARIAIQNAIDAGDITKASGNRLLKQIEAIGDDPLKAFDWVQDVNKKYKKKYERGTIEDTATGKIADDVAQILRNNLDIIVDRKGYAEAFSNNQELKRMILTIAKKANKGVNFGDITSEAGLDAGIALLTGNPAYMARTVASGVFRGLMNSIKRKSGLRQLRKAIDITKELPTETKLPSGEVKPSNIPLLPAPKSGSPKSLNKVPIKLGSRSQSTVDAQEIARIQSNLSSKSNPERTLINEARKYKSAEEFVKAQGTPVYRGGADLSKEKITDAGVSVSGSKNVADDFVKQKGGTVQRFFISPNAKIVDYADVPNVKFKNLNDYSPELDTGNRQIWRDLEVEYQKAVNWAKSNGYDGVKLPLEGETRIINPDVLKTKSELEQIKLWEKANN